MEQSELCRFLEWDTKFFGFRIARVIPDRFSQKTMGLALNWCQSNAIDCLYFQAATDHQESIHLAELCGFNLFDIRMTFELSLKNRINTDTGLLHNVIIRPWKLNDLPTLKNIARNIYFDTRFYLDSKFPKKMADELYATWVEKSCHGYADIMLVLEYQGEAAGYITCNLLDRQTGNIGLVGVSTAAQGVGAGQLLMQAALEWFAEHNADHVTVVTQGRNIKAQRLYQKCGFQTRNIQLAYHKWFNQ